MEAAWDARELLEDANNMPRETAAPAVDLTGPDAPRGLHMLAMLTKHQIPECMHAPMLEFTPAEFGLVATSLDDLSNFISENLVFPALPSSALITARVRMLWRECHALSAPGAASSSAPSAGSVNADSGWSEVFPKKLSSDSVQKMIKTFKSRYPSETLSPDSMPGPRLLALVSKQLQDRDWKYIPWKMRMSQELHEQSSMTRPHKQPRLEHLLYDEVPSREIPSAGEVSYVGVTSAACFRDCIVRWCTPSHTQGV